MIINHIYNVSLCLQHQKGRIVIDTLAVFWCLQLSVNDYAFLQSCVGSFFFPLFFCVKNLSNHKLLSYICSNVESLPTDHNCCTWHDHGTWMAFWLYLSLLLSSPSSFFFSMFEWNFTHKTPNFTPCYYSDSDNHEH